MIENLKKFKEEDYFNYFLWGCFDKSFDATRAGVDKDVIPKFTPKEQAIVETMILERLPSTYDSRPVIAAGIMRLKKASPILKERLAKGIPEEQSIFKIETVHALFLIDNWSDAVEIITSIILNKTTSPFDFVIRRAAVQASVDFGKNAYTLPILFETIEDEEVGFYATDSLKSIYSADKKVLSLLNQMHKAQIKPVREKPEFIKKRRVLFQKLEKLTNIRMPLIKKTT